MEEVFPALLSGVSGLAASVCRYRGTHGPIRDRGHTPVVLGWDSETVGGGQDRTLGQAGLVPASGLWAVDFQWEVAGGQERTW